MHVRSVAVLGVLVGCYSGSSTPAPVAPRVIEQPRQARTAADPLGFLPGDSEVVAAVDAVKLRRSSLWARLEPTLTASLGPALAEVRARCGFDLLQSVGRLSVGMKDLGAPKPTSVIVVRGLSRDAVMGCLAKEVRGQARVTVDHGVVSVRGEGAEAPNHHFAFADGHTLVLLTGAKSSAAGLRAVLDGGVPLRRSAAFLDLFGRLDTERSAWFVVNGTATIFDTVAALGIKPRAALGWFDVAVGLVANVRIRFDDAAAAQNLVTLAQGQLGAARMFVERIEVQDEDADVVVDAALTDEQLATLTSLLWP